MKHLLMAFAALLFFLTAAANVFALTEGHFRWRYDDGGQTSGTWRQSENANDTLTSKSNVRLRIELYQGSSPFGAASGHLSIYYSTDDTNFTQITTDSSSNAWVLSRSANFFDGDSTTSQLTDNYTFSGGVMIDSTDTVSYSLPVSSSDEYEFCIAPTSHAASATLYYFRMQDLATGPFPGPPPYGPGYDRTPTLLYLNGFGAATKAATYIGGTSATLNGTVYPDNVSTTVRFVYGRSSGSYTDSVAATQSPVTGGGLTAVSASPTGLSGLTTYYYRVAATGGGDYVRGDEKSFTTQTSENHALKFNGVDDYVEIPNTSALNPSLFTYEFWARVDGGSGSYRAPVSSRYWDGSNMYGVNFYADASDLWSLQWGPGTASSFWAGIEGPAVVDGQWAHLAATYDGTTMRFYENGALQGDSVCAFAVNTVTPLRFGSIADNLNFFFNGELDEVRVWNVARTQAEIQSTMNTTLTGNETGLVGYWRFDQSGTVTTAYAQIGGYNGTLNNFAFDGSDGWVPAVDLALPVQATDFLAKANAGSVTLSWKTGSEVNNAGFNVLREDPVTNMFKLIASYTGDGGRSYSFTDSKVKSGASYKYKIQSVTTGGITNELTTLQATVGLPTDYALYQNYPNPFNPSTTIRFDLKQQSTVTLDIYNVLGQRVMEQQYGQMDAGRYNEVVSMDKFASGVYYYRINAIGNGEQKFVSVKKLVLMK